MNVPRPQGASRHKSSVFRFDSGHPLYKTHQQRVRSKLYIPALSGGRPPDFRALIDESNFELKLYDRLGGKSRKSIQKAVEYYLTLLLPWKLQSDSKIRAVGELQPDLTLVATGAKTKVKPTRPNQPDVPTCESLSWTTFVNWIQILDGKLWDHYFGTYVYERPTFRNRCIREYLENVTRNLRTTSTAKKLVMQHRHKCSTRFETAGVKCKLGVCDIADYITRKLRRQKGSPMPHPDGVVEGGEYDPDTFFADQDIYPAQEIQAIEALRDEANSRTTLDHGLENLLKEESYLQQSRDGLASMMPNEFATNIRPTDKSSSVYRHSLLGDVSRVDEVWQQLISKEDAFEVPRNSYPSAEVFTIRRRRNKDFSHDDVARARNSFPAFDSFFNEREQPSDDQRRVLHETYDHCVSKALHGIFPSTDL